MFTLFVGRTIYSFVDGILAELYAALRLTHFIKIYTTACRSIVVERKVTESNVCLKMLTTIICQ